MGSEGRFWESYYQDILDESNGELGYKEIQMQGNSELLLTAGGLAVISAALLAMETMLMLCWPYNAATTEDDTSVDPNMNLKDFAIDVPHSTILD